MQINEHQFKATPGLCGPGESFWQERVPKKADMVATGSWVPKKYIDIVQEMCRDTESCVRTPPWWHTTLPSGGWSVPEVVPKP